MLAVAVLLPVVPGERTKVSLATGSSVLAVALLLPVVPGERTKVNLATGSSMLPVAVLLLLLLVKEQRRALPLVVLCQQ